MATADSGANHWMQHDKDETSPDLALCLQRFSQGNALKKTIFELIAGELLKAAAMPEAALIVKTADGKANPKTGSGHGMRHFRYRHHFRDQVDSI